MQRRSKYKSQQNWPKPNLRFVLVLLLPLLGVLSLQAQVPYFITPSVNEQLSDEQIQTAFESKDGFIWLGTNEGLYRYDGIDYQAFSLPDTVSSTTPVTCIFQTKTNKVLAGFQNGQIYQVVSGNKLEKWATRIPTDKPIQKIAQYEDQFWIATYGAGLFVQTADSTYQLTVEDGLYGDDIYDLYLFEDRSLGLLATDRGISQVQFQDGRFTIQNINDEAGLPNFVVRCILPAPKGNFYIGTYDNGLLYWNPKDSSSQVIIEDWDFGVINSLCLFEERELWVGTERKGIVQYDLNEKVHRVYGEINNVSTGKIFDLLKDQEGNLWIIGSAIKIAKANRHFDFLESYPEEIREIQALLQDRKDNLWIGTQDGSFLLTFDEDGLPHFERKLQQIQSNILSFYEDRFGNIWIGTFGEGLYIYNEERNRIRHLTAENGLVDGSVLSMDGSNEKVWVGTLAGVTEFDAQINLLDENDFNYEQYDAEDQLNAAFIYKVFADSKGRTWLGTDGEGLYIIENEELRYVPVTDSIKFSSVYSIAEDNMGNIWFTSPNKGLFRYNGNQFKQFDTRNGLRNLNITSLVTDKNGQLLILHTSGIDILNPETLQVIYYDEDAGISNLQSNLNVFCKGKNGDVCIGGQNKLLKYMSPREKFRMMPGLSLDKISVEGNEIDPAQQSRFRYNKNTFVFSFKGIWLTAPEELQYRYKLEGLDDRWLYTRDQEVNYVNLPPGTYLFKVGATSNNLFDESEVIEYSFRIGKPFYASLWFIALMVYIFASGLFFFLRSREKRILKESKLKREKIESQFEALKSQINPHFLFNSFNTLVAIIEENPHTAVNYVERLSDFYRSILQYRNKTVIPLAEELTMVNNYYFLLRERFGNNLQLHISTKEKEAYVPPLSLQMLVENAIKHNIVSSFKPLTITIEQDDRGNLVVKNTLQPKRTRPKSTSFGLSSIVARYALLSDKRVSISKTETEFIVRLPLIKSQYSENQVLETSNPIDELPIQPEEN